MYKNHHAHSITMIEYTERQKNSIRINIFVRKTANHIEMPYTNIFLFEVILESTIKSAD